MCIGVDWEPIIIKKRPENGIFHEFQGSTPPPPTHICIYIYVIYIYYIYNIYIYIFFFFLILVPGQMLRPLQTKSIQEKWQES